MYLNQIQGISLTLFTLFLMSVSLFGQVNNDDKLVISYDKDSNKTTVFLPLKELPNNSDSFSVGAFFEFKGKKQKEMPCCVGILFKSASRENFKYKDNHNLTIWADNEKMEFSKITWRESPEGFALIVAKIAFLEDMLAAIKADQFFTIANSKKVEMQIGDFKFNLTDSQLQGFQNLADKMKNFAGNKERNSR